MQLHEIAAEFIKDTQASMWPGFAPEIVICLTILLMLLVRVFRFGRLIPGAVMAMAGVVVALYFQLGSAAVAESHEIFTGMLVLDTFTVYLRMFLLVFALLFIVFTVLSRIPDQEDAVDFYCLVLGSTLGMCLMASANHLLIVFLAVEMASVPSYALAGQLKFQRKSSEAALKYAIYGAGAAGVMLYGISLVAGVMNTAHLPTIALELTERLPMMSGQETMVLGLGGLMIMVGLAFKLSAVPFHFWCPDVFEGASAEVNAFLSIASKAAALALLVRVAVGVSVPSVSEPVIEAASAPAAVHATAMVADEADIEPVATPTGDPLIPVRHFIGLLVGGLAAVTCTFGNLAAYAQTNIKRLMAYSTIAHAGYMMLAIPAAIEAAGVAPEVARNSIAALVMYVSVYLLMNLGAFAVIAFFRNSLQSEEIADYSGIVKRSPIIMVAFALILFSLVGLPPLAGFFGKFAIFAALADSWRVTGHVYLLWLLVIGGMNTAISLFYYLRVVKVMTIDPERDGAPVPLAPISFLAGTYVLILTIPVVTLLIYINRVNEWTQDAAKQLF